MAVAAEKPKLDDDDTLEAAVQRLSVSLPPLQSDALTAMSKTTGLTKAELIRQAVALLNVAVRARARGLDMALTNDENEVVGHIVSTV